jgi:O-antigen/teichoic acid export membrane protein
MMRDGVSTALNLFTTIILARNLGPETLGVWFVYLTIFSLLDALFRTKTETSSVYFLASKQISFEDLERCLLLVSFFTSLIACLIIAVLGDEIYRYFFNGLDENYRFHFYSVLLTFALSLFATCYFYLALGLEDYRLYNLTILAQSIVNFVFVFIFSFILSGSIWIPIFSLNISWAIAAAIGFLYFRKFRSHSFNFFNRNTLALTPNILKSGLTVYASSLIKTLQEQLPRLFIIGLFPVSHLAYLGQSQLIVNLVIRFSTAIGNVLYPRLASLDQASQVELIQKVVRISLILNAVFLFILYLIVEPLVVVVYGDQYLDVADYLKILIPSAFFIIPGLLLEQLINGRGDFSLKILINISSFTAMILSLLLFYSNLSPFTIAISIAMSNVVYSATVFLIIKRKYKIEIGSFIPGKEDCMLVMKFVNIIR